MQWWLRLSPEHKLQVMYGLKLVIALVIGFFLTRLIPDPHSIWVVITIITIMMAHISVNVQLQKAIARVLGTVIGAILGTLAFLLHPADWAMALIIALVATLFFTAKVRNYLRSYAANLGLMTFCIVAINPSAELLIGLNRALEILIGIVVSICVSRFIFPIQSSSILQLYLDKKWGHIQSYASKILRDQKQRHLDSSVIHTEQKIMRVRDMIRELEESAPSSSPLENASHHTIVSRYQMGVYRYITVMELLINRGQMRGLMAVEALKEQIMQCNTRLLRLLDSVGKTSFAHDLQAFNQSTEKLDIFFQEGATLSSTSADQTLLFMYNRTRVLLQALNQLS